MPIRPHQLAHRVGVPLGRRRIDLRRVAPPGPLDDPQRRTTHLHQPIDPVVLGPRRRPAEINVGPKPHLVPHLPQFALERPQARQRQQAHRRLQLIAEHMPRHVMKHRRAPRFIAQERGQERPDPRPTLRRQRRCPHPAPIRRLDRQHALMRIESRPQPGDPLVLQQAHEVRLVPEHWRRRVEPRIPLCQGKRPVPRQRLPRLEIDPLQRLRRQPLHRIPI